MKHNIRINGEVKEIDCEFGSGILDKHGKEIFEGDIVKISSGILDKHGKEIFEGDIVKISIGKDYYVDCQYGVFCIRTNADNAIYSLRELDECDIEIVGHVED